MSALVNRSEVFQSAIASPVVQYLDQFIHQYEKWQNVALGIRAVALCIIGTALTCTALVYASPVIPVAAVVLIGVLCAFALVQRESVYHGQYYGFAPLFLLACGLSGKIGKMVYTPEVAAITLVANGALIGPATVVALLSAGLYEFLAGKVEHFRNLRTHAKSLESDSTYFPPKNISRELLPTYNKVYIQPYARGLVSMLPLDLEGQMIRLGWIRA